MRFELSPNNSYALCLFVVALATGCPGPELAPCDHDPIAEDHHPQITSFTPVTGRPGTVIKIRGQNLDQIIGDSRYQLAYGDVSSDCDYGSMDWQVENSRLITAVIPQDATLSGFLYLTVDGLTLSRAPDRFDLELPETIEIYNGAQFPIAIANVNLNPVLAEGVTIGVGETGRIPFEDNARRLELCTVVEDRSTGIAQHFCRERDLADVEPGMSLEFEPMSAGEALVGAWANESGSERLYIRADGSWHRPLDGGGTESGQIIQHEWPAFARRFSIQLHEFGSITEIQVPAAAFDLQHVGTSTPTRYLRQG